MPKKISGLLTEYFSQDQNRLVRPLRVSGNTQSPIQPSDSSWEIHTDPERFSRRYKFDSRNRMISFLNEVMTFEDEFGHHGEIRIDHTEVDISVYTHDINRITELDKEYIKHVDNIHRDVLDFEY